MITSQSRIHVYVGPSLERQVVARLLPDATIHSPVRTATAANPLAAGGPRRPY